MNLNNQNNQNPQQQKFWPSTSAITPLNSNNPQPLEGQFPMTNNNVFRMPSPISPSPRMPNPAAPNLASIPPIRLPLNAIRFPVPSPQRMSNTAAATFVPQFFNLPSSYVVRKNPARKPMPIQSTTGNSAFPRLNAFSFVPPSSMPMPTLSAAFDAQNPPMPPPPINYSSPTIPIIFPPCSSSSTSNSGDSAGIEENPSDKDFRLSITSMETLSTVPLAFDAINNQQGPSSNNQPPSISSCISIGHSAAVLAENPMAPMSTPSATIQMPTMPQQPKRQSASMESNLAALNENLASGSFNSNAAQNAEKGASKASQSPTMPPASIQPTDHHPFVIQEMNNKMLKRKIDQLNGKINKLQAANETNAQELAAKESELNEKLGKKLKAEFAAKKDELKEKFAVKLKKELATKEGQLKEELAAKESQLKEKFAVKLKKELATKEGQLKEELAANESQMAKEFAEKVGQLKVELAAREALLREELAAKDGQLKYELAEKLKEEFAAKEEQLKGELAAKLEEELATKEGQLNEELTAKLKEELAAKEVHLKEEFATKLEEELATKEGQLKEELAAKESKLREDFAANESQMAVEFAEKVGQLKKVIVAREKQLNQEVETKEKEWSEEMAKINKHWKKEVARVENRNAALQITIRSLAKEKDEAEAECAQKDYQIEALKSEIAELKRKKNFEENEEVGKCRKE